ncbi:ELMO domain-containing protein 1 [Trichonephila inaurata madagascariensis]|uniref:ELMO domain-containing protein 1 n=1 Tax=Trichonephila inaurata madagascariensis TaxID=2747483 RepID=A0A8X7CGQ4_9ARAC|nr:ELMO domain-containing protein 1 [Trichonephila inaurata madagascariensis]
MISIIVSLFSYIKWYFRPALKWFLRKTTRLCELQRICYGEEFGFNRSSKIETSLNLSRTKDIQQMAQQLNSLATQGRFIEKAMRNCVEYAMKLTIDVKGIKPSFHMPFINNYKNCLYQIYGYKQLLYEVEILRKTPYSSENKEHEDKLLKLWALLNPDKPLQSRISKQWTEIGFQGDDPKTDFRGMGILGLENLLYFATEHCEAARHVLLHSNHPNYGYSFAIVGINLTSMAYDMLKNQSLQVHFYNSIKGKPSIDHFHFVYCYLFYEFDKFWLSEKPRDIMEFSRIRAKFQTKILKHLENPKTQLKLSFLIKTL